MTKKLLAPLAFVLVLLLGVYGCNSPEPETPAATTPASTSPAKDVADDDHSADSHAEHEKGSNQTDMEKMTEQLASFSPEDRESAIKQHVCPVSGEMLGTMGAPKKVDVNGQSVWICCDGCKDKLLAEPDKYLAKIAKE